MNCRYCKEVTTGHDGEGPVCFNCKKARVLDEGGSQDGKGITTYCDAIQSGISQVPGLTRMHLEYMIDGLRGIYWREADQRLYEITVKPYYPNPH